MESKEPVSGKRQREVVQGQCFTYRSSKYVIVAVPSFISESSDVRWRRALVGGNKYTNPQHLETEKTSAHKSEHISLKERMKALKSSVFSSKSKSKEIPETWHTNSQYSVVDEGRTHSVTTADSKSPTSPGKLVCMPIPGKEYQSHTNRQRIMVDASFPAGCALQDFFSESCFQSPLEPVVVWVSDTTAIILLPLG
eukprot:4410972-Pyramimonas_sp.AAC.1